MFALSLLDIRETLTPDLSFLDLDLLVQSQYLDFDHFLIPFLISEMQLFDAVRVVGMTPDQISVIEIIQIYDHDEVLTPGNLLKMRKFFSMIFFFRFES